MKKILAIIIIMNLLLLVLTSCGSNNEQNQSTTTLSVYNWGDYIDPEVIDMFYQETGIKINYETFDTNEAMYTKLKSGAVKYDILFPSDYMIEKLISEDLLYPINKENIPNYKYIEDNFRDLEFDPGNIYSIPYMWGTVGILYNTTMVDEPVDSWDILWNEKYSNSILMQNSVRDTFAVALKKLGYSLNTTNKDEIEEAKDLLIQQKPLVSAYVIDEVKDKMIGNESALAVIYSGEALNTSSQNPDLDYAVPKEGSNIWVDAVCIPNSSQNKEAAEKFINFLNEPEIAFMNADYIFYSSPHSGAKEMFDEDVLGYEALYPSQEVIDRCEVFVDLGPEMTLFYDEKWTELKSH